MANIDLNDTDTKIINELREGRNTPANLADRIGVSRQYASQRIKRLTEHGILEKVDRGLYELVEDPREVSNSD
ncbi:winged helix-turn-helix transcriptional regulator [Halorutilales archaeon Cl-col2-1]